MFDFPFQEPSIWTALYCLCAYLIIVGLNYKKAVVSNRTVLCNRSYNRSLLFFVGFFVVTHCLKGDFFHMLDNVHHYEFIKGAYNYGEDVYISIAKLVNRNYLLFRVVVFGGSFCFFYFTVRRYGLSVNRAVVFFLISYVITFSYARASAAMSLYYFGLSFFCVPSRDYKILGYVIGVIAIYCCLDFHNSAIIMVLMTSMLIVPMKKWSMTLIVLLLPIIAVVVKDLFYVIAFADATDELMARKLQNYSDREREQGIAAIIISICQYASFYLPFILSSICLFSKNNLSKVSNGIKLLYRVMFGLIMFSIVFLLFGSSFTTFFYRILYMTMIPMVIVVCYLVEARVMSPKFFNLCLIPGLCYHVLRYLYDVYLLY